MLLGTFTTGINEGNHIHASQTAANYLDPQDKPLTQYKTNTGNNLAPNFNY